MCVCVCVLGGGGGGEGGGGGGGRGGGVYPPPLYHSGGINLRVLGLMQENKYNTIKIKYYCH